LKTEFLKKKHIDDIENDTTENISSEKRKFPDDPMVG